MTRRILAILSLSLAAFGGEVLAQASNAPPLPPPRPPFRFVPSLAPAPEANDAYVRCPDCAGDLAPVYVLRRDGVTFNVSARPTAAEANGKASGKTAITVTIQTPKPSDIDAREDYITLRNKDDNREFLLAPSDYKIGIYNLQDMEPRPASQNHWVDHGQRVPRPDEWPAAHDVTESSLDFYVGADLLSGSFSVQLPKITVNGKLYDIPPIAFDPEKLP